MQENQTATVVAPVSGRVFEKIAYYVLLLMSFLVPVFFVPSSFISTDFGTSLLFAYSVIIAVICYIIATFLSGVFTLPHSNKIGLSLFVIVPAVYLLAGISNGFSRFTFIGLTFDQSTVGFILLAFAYLFLVSVLFRSSTRIFYSFVAFLASSIIFSLFLIIRIIFGTNILSFGVFTSLTSTMIGTWNNVAMFAGIGLLLSMFSYYMLDASRLMKILLVIAFVVSFFFLVLVDFNFIWIAVALSALLFVLYTIFTSRRDMLVMSSTLMQKVRMIPLLPAITLVLSLVCMFWGNAIVSHLGPTFAVNNVEVRPSLSVTLDIARQTIQTRPLFGSGPNTFVTQWLSYKPDDITSTAFWNTDFQYGIGLLLTFAVTTGLVGVLSWLLFLGVYVYFGWKALFARIEDSFLKYLTVSSFFVSLYLWIMAVIYLPSIVLIILTFFFTGLFLASLSVAGIFSMVPVVFTINPRKGFGWSLVFVTVFVAAVVLGYSLYKNSEALWYFQKSSYALNTSGDILSSESLMKQAIATVSYDTYYRALAQIEIAKLGKIEAQDPKTVAQTDLQKEVTDTLSDAITAGLNARNADPANYLNWVTLGQVYEAAVPLKIQNAYQSAQVAYNEAFRRNPKNPGIYLLLSQLEVDNGSLPNAVVYAQQAIQMKPNYLDAYFLLAQIAVAGKDLKGAIDSVAAASVINPTDPSILFQLGYLKFSGGDYTGAIDALQKSLSLSPQYANAKYYLGLSDEALGRHTDALAQFTDIQKTNPDNATLNQIVTALKAGKSIFQTQQPVTTSTKINKTLPVTEPQQ